MFTVTDHQRQTTSMVESLPLSYAAARRLIEATVCDPDGVIRATVQGGVFMARNESGFPEQTPRGQERAA